MALAAVVAGVDRTGDDCCIVPAADGCAGGSGGGVVLGAVPLSADWDLWIAAVMQQQQQQG